jgi:hypothetical protein
LPLFTNVLEGKFSEGRLLLLLLLACVPP